MATTISTSSTSSSTSSTSSSTSTTTTLPRDVRDIAQGHIDTDKPRTNAILDKPKFKIGNTIDVARGNVSLDSSGNVGFIDAFNYANTAELEAVYTKNANTTTEMNVGTAGITGGTELIRNGSFEEGLSSWSRFEGQDAANWGVNIVSDVKKDGIYSARVWNTTLAEWISVAQYIVLQPNTTYYFSGYMKLENANQAHMKITTWDSAWESISLVWQTGGKSGTADWTHYTGSFTTGATVAYGQVACMGTKNPASGTAYTWFDKIRLSTSPTDYDVKGGLQKTTGDYRDCTYQAKLQNIWTTSQYVNCDAVAPWTRAGGDALAIDTDDKKEGTGSLVFNKTTTATANCYITHPLANQDLSANDYFYFWFKTSTDADLAKITYTQCLFYTTGTAYSWYYNIDKARQFPNGKTWYGICIDKNKFSTKEGFLNWADIDGFRFYVYTSTAADTLGNMKIDDISFQNIRGLEQGIYARATDENNCYRFVTKNQYTVALQKLVSGIVTDLGTALYDTSTQQDYYFGIQCSGSSIKCWISASEIDTTSTPTIDATDSFYSTGKIGIFNNVAHTHIDDLKISKLGTITGKLKVSASTKKESARGF